MDTSKKNYNEKLSELEAKTHDTGFFEEFLGKEHIPVESLAAMGSNTTLEEFLKAMKASGLEVHLKPKAEKQAETERAIDPRKISLNPAIDNTSKNKKAYAKNLQEASEKMGGDTGLIESIIENKPDDPVEDINTAGYEGEFNKLKNLSKDL